MLLRQVQENNYRKFLNHCRLQALSVSVKGCLEKPVLKKLKLLGGLVMGALMGMVFYRLIRL